VLYLLDANVLIDANRDYYPLQRVPEFWEWLAHHGEAGSLAVPLEIAEELEAKNDDLSAWIGAASIKKILTLKEEAQPDLVDRVVTKGYASDLTDDEIEQLGRDPFLIAYCLVDLEARCVVTTEASKPRRKRANRHIPDVCSDLGVSCLSAFQFFRELNFKTGWRDE
jgi:hypothetical protein